MTCKVCVLKQFNECENCKIGKETKKPNIRVIPQTQKTIVYAKGKRIEKVMKDKNFLKMVKKKLNCGATVKEGIIELQGQHSNQEILCIISEFLEASNYL
jgi:translation initiation factor 1 (eIF-1/SUI1)